MLTAYFRANEIFKNNSDTIDTAEDSCNLFSEDMPSKFTFKKSGPDKYWYP